MKPRKAEFSIFGMLLMVCLGLHMPLAMAQVCADKHWVDAPQMALSIRSGDESGIGGTGHGDEESGIGGTGIVASRPTGGDGIGGTGIIGVVAGFGSICVNGQEVHYDASTRISQDGLPTSAATLALGQMVSVRASELAAGEYSAREIAALNAVKGRVEQLDLAAGSLRILGQQVRIPPTEGALLAVGDLLAVAGNRLDDGSILATRIERVQRLDAPSAQVLSLIGTVTQVDEQGFHIGDLAVRSVTGRLPEVGQQVQVRGRLDHEVLQADVIVVQPFTAFASPVDRLLIQGYARGWVGQQLNVDGILVNVTAEQLSAAGMHAGARVEVVGSMAADGRIVAERLELRGAAGEIRGERSAQIQAGRDETANANRAQVRRPDRIEAGDASSARPDVMRPEINRPDVPHADMLRPHSPGSQFGRPDFGGSGRPMRGR